jgi:hypothetical protein
MAEAERFPGSLGPWRFMTNGVEGKMTLRDDGNGNLSGTIDETQQLLGFWDANLQKVTFLRIVDPTDPSAIQVYSGYLFSHGEPIDIIAFTLTGSYQAFSDSDTTAQRNVFGWNASMSRPA